MKNKLPVAFITHYKPDFFPYVYFALQKTREAEAEAYRFTRLNREGRIQQRQSTSATFHQTYYLRVKG